ncbi:hypothetical protein SLEP1_g28723 [Rubroshorea leprosula]|nr:hypothetical protein SLEP1_g28723 [Rubroshorea leprosula]
MIALGSGYIGDLSKRCSKKSLWKGNQVGDWVTRLSLQGQCPSY